jgi:hypothetical protein
MTTIEQLEARMQVHELRDAEIHGSMLGHLGRIETHLAYLVKANERLEDQVETTGSHQIAQSEKRADFWPKLVGGIVAALVVAAITGLVSYLVMHK